MKNRLFYFAACVALVLSSVSCSSDDGEEEDADIPVVGKIAVSGAYNVLSRRLAFRIATAGGRISSGT